MTFLTRCTAILCSSILLSLSSRTAVAQNEGDVPYTGKSATRQTNRPNDAIVIVLPGNGSTSGNGRAPQGSRLYNNSKYLITGAEMTTSGFTGQVSSVGWRWNVPRPMGAGAPSAQSVATTGNLKVFLKDTAGSATGLIGTFIDTNGVGYTKVIDATISITRTDTLEFTIDVPVGGPGTSPFTPTPGSGLLVLYVYNTTTPLATPVGAPTVFCTNVGSILTYQSQTVNGTTGAASTFRPETRFGNTPQVPDTLLVLVHDSTTTTSLAKRKADRDTLFKYLPSIAPVYKVVYIDTNGAALPSLTNYKSILYQETSFDAITCRFLGTSSRLAIKNWLNSGTPSNKKRLVMVGGDLAYNYSQSAQASTDTTLAHEMLKFVYGVDNGNTALSITGVGVNPGGVLTYASTVPGGGFYPDGCTYRPGGNVLYKYTNRATADSVAGVGYVASGYTAASLFLDPRYFTGNGPTGGFPKALRDMLQFAGVITDVKLPASNELPNDFVLTQNYPNPFNPTTTIQFGLPVAANVSVRIYNVLGQEVATLVDGMRGVGTFQATWNGRNSVGAPVASGMYFYSLVAKTADGKATFTSFKKMLLLK